MPPRASKKVKLTKAEKKASKRKALEREAAENEEMEKLREGKIARIAEDLRLEIKRHAAKKGSLRSPFNHFDRVKRKRFTVKDFVEGVRDIGFDWNRADAEKVFAQLDLNGDGRVSFKEFKVFVKDPNFKDVESRARVALMRAAGSASPFEHSRRYAMFSFLFGAYIFYAASLARHFCFARLEGQG